MSETGEIERQRTRLPQERDGFTKKWVVGGHKGYLIVGHYPDGRPGEIFIRMAKEGSTMAGMMDALAISVSVGLQSGVPMATYCRKFIGARFEPAGVVLHDEHQTAATSIPDYLFRFLARRYCPDVLGEPAIVEALRPTSVHRASRTRRLTSNIHQASRLDESLDRHVATRPRLSEQLRKRENWSQQSEQAEWDRYWEYVDRAAKIVEKWPDWMKSDVLVRKGED